MDTFIEYMVQKKKTKTDIIKILLSVLGAMVLTVVIGYISTLTGQTMFLIWFVLVVAMWYGVYVIISRQNIEYEYSFTNGELDIDAVYSKRRRVHMLSVRVRDFAMCAPLFDEKFKSECLNVGDVKKTYHYMASMDSDKTYFADFLQNGDKVRLYFEPSGKMIEAIKLFNPRNVHTNEMAEI